MATQDKVLTILGAFSIERPSMTLAELARATELPLSTVHRLVARLMSWGALERDHRHRYAIGLRMWQLGVLSPSSFQQRALVVPYLEQLFLETHEPVALSVFHSAADIVVEQLLGWRDADFAAGLGERLPLHATSPGLILLAFGPPQVWQSVTGRPLRRYTSHTVVDPTMLRRVIEGVRRTEIARSDGALVATTSSMSAPVFGHRGELYGAVTLMWSSDRVTPEGFEARLASTGRKISAAMRESMQVPLPHPVRRGVFDPTRTE